MIMALALMKISKIIHVDVSLRIVAVTLLGKDQGTPHLKSDVISLGKLVGYDSDEETEWEGFG